MKCRMNYTKLRVARGLEPIPATTGQEAGTPWTGRQSDAGPTQRETIVHTHS